MNTLMKDRMDRVQHRLLRFGKKNKFCYIFAFLLIKFFTFIKRFTQLFTGNTKKLSVLFLDILYLALFASFLFQRISNVEDPSTSNLFENMNASEVQDTSFENLSEMEVDIAEDFLEYLDQVQRDGPLADMDMTDDTREEYLESLDASEILAKVRQDMQETSDSLNVDVDDIIASYEGTKPYDVLDHTIVSYDDYTFKEDDWRLILVDKQHFIPSDYQVHLGIIKGWLQCDERIIEDLVTMLSDAADEGVNLTICSPYRTSEHQVELFDKKIKRFMSQGMSYMEAYKEAGTSVTIPGTSEHEIGLALDIVCDTYNALNDGFGETDAGKWLFKNCSKYGFILRYPKGKEYITTIEYEPWHFRYVGVEAATLIMQEGITLEEFWEEMF